MMPEPESEEARARVRQILQYLRAFDQLRNPIVCSRDKLVWRYDLDGLPESEYVWCAYPPIRGQDHPPLSGLRLPEGSESRTALLVVRRPALAAPPDPAHDMERWVQGDWRSPESTISIKEKTQVWGTDPVVWEALDQVPGRFSALQAWLARWRAWAKDERPRLAAAAVFSELYRLHGLLEREGDKLELTIGDGVLSWRIEVKDRPPREVDFPLILKRVELLADFKAPAFVLFEAEAPVELNSPLLHLADELTGATVLALRRELEDQDLSPLGGEETTDFLKALTIRLSGEGAFTGRVVRPASAIPQVARSPLLFVRSRARGYSEAIRQLLEGLEAGRAVPVPLARVGGCHPLDEGSTNGSDKLGGTGGLGSTPEGIEILFAKPWNEEQARVVEQLEKSDSVIVQGPPGTGKSHTIANVLGHLLARGKTVLVTSQTEKALAVLRGHVVEALRPLCLPVLTGDAESSRQLQRSVEDIIARLGENANDLDRRASTLRARRTLLASDCQQLSDQLRDVALSEYRPIATGAESIDPAMAAKHVRNEAPTHSWLPGPLVVGSVLPLSPDEIKELYSSNALVPPADVRRLRRPLPSPSALPGAPEIEALARDLSETADVVFSGWNSLWRGAPPVVDDPEALQGLLECICEVSTAITTLEPWQRVLAEQGHPAAVERAPWEQFLIHLDQELPQLNEWEAQRLRHGTTLPPGLALEDAVRIAGAITEHVGTGGGLGAIVLAMHREWKGFIHGALVDGHRPRTAQHFQALRDLAILEQRRKVLLGWWRRIGARLPLGSEMFEAERVEVRLTNLRPLLGAGLAFFDQHLQPMRTALEAAGMDLKELDASLPPRPGQARLQHIQDELLPALANELRSASLRVRRRRAEATATRVRLQVSDAVAQSPDHIAKELKQAADNLDSQRYAQALSELTGLERLRPALARRDELLQKLKAFAPGWADAIAERGGVHGGEEAPEDPAAAWRWRLLTEELDRRAELDAGALGERLKAGQRELERTTGHLIEHAAWAAQIRRVRPAVRSALVGWQDTIKRTPRTSTVPGKLERLRRQAREQLREASAAVPVWIMPMTKALEQFDLGTQPFDVVIVDEASQTDIFGLLLLALGKKVLVVGDHEQVSPLSVGLNEAEIGRLIHEHLEGVPNKELFDGKASIYQFARQIAGETITLLEHFRCVPPIIAFSNDLCYDGRIRPLREAAAAHVFPPLVPLRVNGHRRGDVNSPEAAAVASLIAASCEQPEYEDLSIGVVSLLGDEQALAIDTLLRRHLEPAMIERHRIVCGNPAHLQGDERDVVFLSMVDAPRGGGPLPLRDRSQEMYRQRYNVAASRAKDQVWVVHSLDPEVDLQPADLRYRLIKHAQNPWALTDRLAEVRKAVQSPFEKLVGEYLVRLGYDLVPQYPVGAYRIDLVARDGEYKLAIECDGDRYHTTEEEVAKDFVRQGVLERLGWQFVRVRGSVFYRDADRAMGVVVDALRKLGIRPGSEQGRPPVPTEDFELVARLLRRAQEIRLQWEVEEDVQVLTNSPSASGVVPPGPEPPPRPAPTPGPRPVPLETRPAPFAPPPGPTPSPPSAPDPRPTPAPRPTPEPTAALRPNQSLSHPAEVWEALAQWSRTSPSCDAKQRKFLDRLARDMTRGAPVSDGDRQWATRLLTWASRLGFLPEGQEPLAQMKIIFEDQEPT